MMLLPFEFAVERNFNRVIHNTDLVGKYVPVCFSSKEKSSF